MIGKIWNGSIFGYGVGWLVVCFIQRSGMIKSADYAPTTMKQQQQNLILKNKERIKFQMLSKKYIHINISS